MKEAIADAFAPDPDASPREQRLKEAHRQAAETNEKGHGRIEHRELTRTLELRDYLDWPHAAQVFQVKRQRTIRGETSEQIAYGVTSLPPERADAKTLLALTRGHWGVENRLHYVRDTTFGEDACRVRSGRAPQILAAMRNLSIGLLERTGWKNKAAALRRHAARPHEALRLIRGSPEN